MFEEPMEAKFYYHKERDLVIFAVLRVKLDNVVRSGWYIRYKAVVVDKEFCNKGLARNKLQNNMSFMMREELFLNDFKEVPVITTRSEAQMGLNGSHDVGTFVHVLNTDCIYKQWPTKGGWVEYFDNRAEYPNTYAAAIARENEFKVKNMGFRRGSFTTMPPSPPKKKSAMGKDAWESRVRAVMGNLDL